MMNPMKRWAGAFVLMMAVGCGPTAPAPEASPPEQAPPSGEASVEAMDLDDFLACVGPISESGRECVEICVEFAPAASLIPCIVSCGLDITDVLGCLDELAQ